MQLAARGAAGARVSAPRVVVIGAGVAGLAAARAIRHDAPHVDLLVLEASGRVGGLVDTERTPNGFVIDHGADALLTANPWGLAVAREPGFADVVIDGGPAPRRSYVSTPGGLVPLPPVFAGASASTALAIATTPLLSLRGKMRVALEPFVPGRRDPDDESVRSFVARRFGGELADKVIEPLVGGIHGHDTARLSALGCLPRLRALEEAHGSVTLAMRRLLRERRRHGRSAPPPAVTFRRGMASLPEALHRAIGDHVRFDTSARRIGRTRDGFTIETAHGAIYCAGVVLATPAWQAPSLVEGLSPELASVAGEIRHKALACVTLAFERGQVPRALDATGWVRGAGDSRTTLACTWASAKWWERAPHGYVLLRCILPVDGSPADLVAAALADLRDLLGVRGEPYLTRVRKMPRATPIYAVGHRDLAARAHAAAEAVGALVLAGNAWGGVGVPDCGSSGEAAARAVLLRLDAVRDDATPHVVASRLASRPSAPTPAP